MEQFPTPPSTTLGKMLDTEEHGLDLNSTLRACSDSGRMPDDFARSLTHFVVSHYESQYLRMKVSRWLAC